MNNLEYKAAYTPKKLTAENRKLNIPIYQRLFVWEEEQINLLLEDLKNAFNEAFDNPSLANIIPNIFKDQEMINKEIINILDSNVIVGLTEDNYDRYVVPVYMTRYKLFLLQHLIMLLLIYHIKQH